MIFNQDLINSCLVCRSPNQDGDFEELFEENTSNIAIEGHQIVLLSEAGNRYEKLISKISPETYEYFPRFLCNSCDLQMKLFGRLKDKALKTCSFLTKLYNEHISTIEQEQNDINELIDEKHIMNQEQQAENIDLSGMEIPIETVEQTTATLFTTTNEVMAVEAFTEEYLSPTILPYSIDTSQIETESDLLNDVQQQSFQPIFEAKNDVETSMKTELKQETEIDKTDYVLEIYKVIEDGAETVLSDTEREMTEENLNRVNIDDFEIEEEALSQYSYTDGDVEYAESAMSTEQCTDDDFIPAKKRKMNKKEVNNDGITSVFNCSECPEIFATAKECKKHRNNAHPPTHICRICSTLFQTARILEQHMKTAHGDIPTFQCDICQRTFNQKVHYQYHMNRHNNIRNFKCDDCEKAFLSKTDLKVHMRQHTGERPYVCECGKSYMLAEHLKSHALKHTDIKFPCKHENCNQIFSTSKTLRQHVSSIHAEPRFKCEYCKKPFRRKHHLQYHMKIHQVNIVEEEEPYTNLDDMDNKTIDVVTPDDIDVMYSPNEVNADNEFVDQDDFIQDSGFVALNDEAMLM